LDAQGFDDGHFTRNVEGKILRVDDSLHEVEVLGYELLAVVHDKDTADVHFDAVLMLAVLKQMERSTAWDEEESAELELAFNREMLDSKMIILVIGP
jgi:hypothetical protein